MSDSRKLNNDYRNYFFIKSDIEDLLGCSIDINEINKKRSYDKLIENLSPQLISLLPRKKIQLKEAANIIAGYQPFTNYNSTEYLDNVKGYRASLWEAVDEGILIGSNEITYSDFGQEWREDITLNKNQVGIWVKKNNLNWPLPLDEDNETNNQNNNEYEQRIKLLEEELNKQKIINSNLEATKSSEQVSINDNRYLTEEINQLKLDNQKLNKQLNEAKQEIEELTKQVPILLGQHRHDDLLLLAIKTRNDIWVKFTNEDPNYKPLSSTQIKNKIKRNNPHLSDRELSSIELVACPIKRGN